MTSLANNETLPNEKKRSTSRKVTKANGEKTELSGKGSTALLEKSKMTKETAGERGNQGYANAGLESFQACGVGFLFLRVVGSGSHKTFHSTCCLFFFRFLSSRSL